MVIPFESLSFNETVLESVSLLMEITGDESDKFRPIGITFLGSVSIFSNSSGFTKTGSE